MRNNLCAAALAWLALAGMATPALAAPSENYRIGRTNWLDARYPQTLPPLRGFRQEPNGRTAEVDYMLGTSGCRATGERAWGARVLNFMLYSYALTVASRKLVTAERDLCRGTGPLAIVSPEARMNLAKLVPAGATARGKLFAFSDGRSIAAYPARQSREIARAELDRRVIPLGERDRIEAEVKRIVPVTARVQIVGRFAFAVYGGQSKGQIDEIAGMLDRYLAFLAAEYGITAPDSYITLHLTPDTETVRRVANVLHGLDVSPATLGYAYQDDLSTVALIRGAQAGTLLHELFHLLVRQSFGDIPQWLDEGMAGLYEVSRFRGDRLEGLPNWRGAVLRNRWSKRPGLDAVVASPWFGFDLVGAERLDSSVSQEDMALNLATARYLALYLQQRGELARVFKAFRDRDPGADEDPGQGAVDIVARLVAPMPQLQRDYETWFGTVGAEDFTNQSDTIGKTLLNAS